MGTDELKTAAAAADANEALALLDRALVLLRGLDADIYWDMAASACDAADSLRPAIERAADTDDGDGGSLLRDECMAAHRQAVERMRPHSRPLGPSATASALDMVALARNLLAPRAPGSSH